jgi:hypothetical protein
MRPEVQVLPGPHTIEASGRDRVGKLHLLGRRATISEAVTEVNGGLVWGTPKGHDRRDVPIPRFLVDEEEFPDLAQAFRSRPNIPEGPDGHLDRDRLQAVQIGRGRAARRS